MILTIQNQVKWKIREIKSLISIDLNYKDEWSNYKKLSHKELK
jgi:hypothetical protein